MKFFAPNSTPGATTLAALRMWQEASEAERAPYIDIATNGGEWRKPLGASGVDQLADNFAGLGVPDGVLEVFEERPAARFWFFAGARDGVMCSGIIPADGWADAQQAGLQLCATHFGLQADEGEDLESALDGFGVVEGLGNERPEEFASAAAIERAREIHGSDEIEIDDNAKFGRADAGEWVAAWVWLPDNYYMVELIAEGINITAKDEAQARRYALADLASCKGWSFTAGEVESITISLEDFEGAEPDFEVEEVEHGGGEDWTVTAKATVIVAAHNETEAVAQAISNMSGELAN